MSCLRFPHLLPARSPVCFLSSQKHGIYIGHSNFRGSRFLRTGHEGHYFRLLSSNWDTRAWLMVDDWNVASWKMMGKCLFRRQPSFPDWKQPLFRLSIQRTLEFVPPVASTTAQTQISPVSAVKSKGKLCWNLDVLNRQDQPKSKMTEPYAIVCNRMQQNTHGGSSFSTDQEPCPRCHVPENDRSVAASVLESVS